MGLEHNLGDRVLVSGSQLVRFGDLKPWFL